ncbi:unnamed protein product [Linum trigynum]|uniref:Thioredoxin domain-containing protein n=1 Tax=Linum trigynum TaxID=586398 RepID=A0AAV2EEE6_9ROSI
MAEEGLVTECQTVELWSDIFTKASESKKLTVVDFTATWCPPCRFIAPILADLAKKMTHVIFLKVDVDNLTSVSEQYDVEAMPTFLFFKEGKMVDKVVGAKKDELVAKIEQHATQVASA